MDPAQQEAFIRHFGPERPPLFKELAGSKTLIDVGTVDDEGKLIGKDTVQGAYNLANRLWHTDGTFLELPIRLTGLLARELPPVPPPTEYANMRAAWDALPAARQAELEGLQVIHSVVRSREQVGFTADKFAPETLKRFPPVPHPLVRIHPFNRRKSLYLASHASHIDGWPVADGRLLLLDLNTHATQPGFVYSHTWRVGDLLIWDNRCTMHRGRPHDETKPRDLRRATTLDTRSTLDEAA
jgi:alpha-ketoglutarate-dependent 2,4-dichlorophenoxyacetate dioxygenase